MNSIVIGTRGSPLALAQANSIADQINHLDPDVEVAIQVIKTTGDRFSASPLSKLAQDTKGLFVKEIEESLLDGSIDLAVHSLKDVPTELPEGLRIGVTPKREEPWDAVVSKDPLVSLAELPAGAKVGTSSPRRAIQLAEQRSDLQILPVRGNIGTRIDRLREDGFDAIVLAAAGLRRLKLENLIAFCLTVEEMVPAIGQGCLALETRTEDAGVLKLIKQLDHPDTRECASAERRFLHQMGGGCQFPMGAYAAIDQNQSRFFAFFASPSGSKVLKESFVGGPDELEHLVETAVSSFRAQGSDSFLKESRD